MNAHSMQPGFTDYVAIVWSRRTLVAFISVIFACLTFIAFNFAPKQYTAMCLFERRDSTVSAQTNGLYESFNSLKPQLAMDITSKLAVRQALTELGYMDNLPRDAAGRLAPDAAAMIERLVDATHANLRVSWITRGQSNDRLSLRLTSRDPILASSMPNQLVKNYIAFTRDTLLGQLNNSATYLQQQIDEWTDRGEKLSARQYDFRMAHPNMMPNDPNFLTEQITQANTQLEEMNIRLDSLRTRLTMLREIKANENRQRISNPGYNILIGRLTQYENQLHEMKTEKMMLDQHPRVRRLEEQIAQARDKLAETPRYVVRQADAAEEEHAAGSMLDVNIENTRSELATAELRVEKLTSQLNQYTEARANYLPIIQEYQGMSQQLSYAEAERERLAKQLNQIQRAIEAEKTGARTQIELISPAKPVYKPSWPALWHIFVIGCFGGLGFAVMTVIIMTRMSRCFDSAEEARNELGLPVLGVIGPIMTPATRRLRAIRKYVLIPATMALLLLVTVLAAAGLVMSTNYPGRYARIMEHLGPVTRAMWDGMQSLLGLM